MKSASKISELIARVANRKLPRWTGRSIKAWSSKEINERGRAAVEDGAITREDTRVLIAETSMLLASLRAQHRREEDVQIL